MYRSLVVLKLILNFQKWIWKHENKTWLKLYIALSTASLQIFVCPITFLSWRYSLLLLFHIFRGNCPEVFYKSWKENEKYLRKSWCSYKSTTIFKMNSFTVIFMDLYNRYGTILWKEEYFVKKAIFVEHPPVAAFRGILRTLSKI